MYYYCWLTSWAGSVTLNRRVYTYMHKQVFKNRHILAVLWGVAYANSFVWKVKLWILILDALRAIIQKFAPMKDTHYTVPHRLSILRGSKSSRKVHLAVRNGSWPTFNLVLAVLRHLACSLWQLSGSRANPATSPFLRLHTFLYIRWPWMLLSNLNTVSSPSAATVAITVGRRLSELHLTEHID